MIVERASRALALICPDAPGDPETHAAASRLIQTLLAAKIAASRGLAGFDTVDQVRKRSRGRQLPLPGLSPGAIGFAPRALDDAISALLDGWDPCPDDVGLAHEVLVAASGERRAKGAHYTPAAVASRVVERALGPLDGRWRVLDLSCGGGAFLLAASRHARARGVSVELFGVDVDPDATHACALALALERGTRRPHDVQVATGDALAAKGDAHYPALFDRAPFDAVVGNPPWVSYAGRAAQPLSRARRERYAEFAAFGGFRNLQALFVERGAALLRPGGRLGLVLPTSMSDLAGYAPSRRAHDVWCAVDGSLMDLEDGGFDGVFQPCMALVSTRRAEALEPPPSAAWPLERADLDAPTAAFLARVGALPTLPPALFGERGYQSLPRDKAAMRDAAFDGGVSLLTGSEVRPFERLPPTVFADPATLSQRLRSADAYRDVAVLIRQTARVPMAALSDGTAFRNSVLAGMTDPDHPAGFLVGWLNAWPIRAFHYVAHRDARQGMPQLKIGHLRALPAPVVAGLVGQITSLGERLGRANTGISAGDQRTLDELVAAALMLTEADVGVVQRVRGLVEG